MKTNNENGKKYILHIKFSWIHVMKNIKISYQLVRRQET